MAVIEQHRGAVVQIAIWITTPPNRESRVAEFWVDDPPGGQPAEVYLQEGRRMIAFYPVSRTPDNIAREMRLIDFRRAVDGLMTGSSDSIHGLRLERGRWSDTLIIDPVEKTPRGRSWRVPLTALLDAIERGVRKLDSYEDPDWDNAS